MKKINFLLIFFALSLLLNSQNNNMIVYDSTLNQQVLIDKIDSKDLQHPIFAEYYKFYFESYNPDMSIVEKIKPLLDDISITIVMGSWCGDSQEQIPKFYKIISLLNFDENKIQLIAVDRKKHAREYDALVQSLNIELIPTFIFYKNGKELGRIIESPQETLETDILKILNQ
ncbi:MAG TPA: thioredoxin family protein [Bacteroidales bacterium]|nr:thioredoxin family protein [Bacteroidales bacterium]HPU46279.1 thioredoxin family protein [Bacteroidales bacterium]HXK90694.1 thioredoxin family protein [Bacteroidales bacterium]